MMMLQEMRKVQIFGLMLEYQEKKSHIFQLRKTGGQLAQLDPVDLIQKYFTGLVKVSFHLSDLMLKMMKIIGWKSGIMYLWNTIDKKIEV